MDALLDALIVERHFVILRDGGRRRVVARDQTHETAREVHDRAPDRTIGGADGHRVVSDIKKLVARRIDGIVISDRIRIAHAIAIGVEHERRPALRCSMIAGLLKQR